MGRRKIKTKGRYKNQAGGSGKKSDGPSHLDVSLDELKTILQQVKSGEKISDEDFEKLDGAVDTLAVLTSELEAKGASVNRLRRLIFGPSSEKTKDVFSDEKSDESSDEADTEASTAGDSPELSKDTETGSVSDEKKKRKGHGRNGAQDYTGANRNKIPHEKYKHKDTCPLCPNGKLYVQKDPAVFVRVRGVAPLEAEVTELERLRCNLCGEVFTASAPEGLGTEKYDATAAAMIAMLKYGCGMPFHRLERLEASLGIPLPASTQWEVVEPAAKSLAPIYTELIRQAAQGEVLHNDDTTARILELMGEKGKQAREADEEMDSKRTGLFTSGIVSVQGGREIATFFTGRKHAGENLAAMLEKRAEELGPPIQMSDGLATNTTGEMETIPSECNVHARRKFVDVADSFPKEVRKVLKAYKAVYKNDDHTKKQDMTPEQRLAYHQEHSGPVMEDLENWLAEQFEQRKVEPNSTLGDAITYAQKHWPKLTLFLRREGAPIDNNICERILKRAILHRKNALFFKTQNGAWVGDLFMTIIHTSELAKINVYEYLVALLRYPDEIAESPALWMPWNYREALENLNPSASS